MTPNHTEQSESGTEQDPRSVPYPGGKTVLAPWIVGHLPNHACYVEPCAGSLAVLLEKERSTVEVANDADGMLVRAYRTIRDQLEELTERLATIPYAREWHEHWMGHLDGGDWPEDDVEATARWLFLRYSQHSAKLTGASGFKWSRRTNPAWAWANAKDALPALADRLDGVILEAGDWKTVADRFDGPETAMYFDPPYPDEGDDLYRHVGDFDHARLVDWVRGAESRCLVSYRRLPNCLRASEYHVVETGASYRGSAREGDEVKDATEQLVMNFDPATVPRFQHGTQETLGQPSGGRHV